MLWTRFSGLACVVLLAIGLVHCEDSGADASIDGEGLVKSVGQKLNKIVFEAPNTPEDAILALYFTSPDDMEKMVLSTAAKEGVDAAISKYEGKWSIEVPATSAIENDYSLVLKSEGKHHAIAIDLGREFNFDKDEFVVQYEVKFMNKQTCGGAYIKLLSASPNLNLSAFHDKTPYTIMFGPDKCGMDSKLHFIFRHKNPKTMEIQEKHMDKPTATLESLFTDGKTHLFTFVTRSDNSFEVYVDQSLMKSGNLLSDFTPPVNPPTEIIDPNDKKPETWDEREKIPDPDAKKPDDWDESAPQFVIDEDATMPDGWLVDTPKLIPDPKAERPSDWNTETDGEWEAPMIDNPDCQSAPGCGPWEKPKKLNPNYKGKWSPPMISNPKFDGIWKPKKIPNPDYFEDKHPFRMTPIRALGLELWSMTADIAFDNFYIGTSKKGADKFASETWVPKQKAEEQSRVDGRSVFDAAVEMVSGKPWHVTAGIAGGFLVLALFFYFCCRSSAAKGDAYYKKTDEPVPDSNPEESDAAGGMEADAERSGSDIDKGEAEEEEDGSDAEEEEEPNPSATRQRTRKE
ncbi:calnexin [Echinococcus multilocularis]|uniref:Calnexin n=1 Tax=Echinococcus multilocularis TaxID=6211 RepID=A0A068YFY2_ECHMU|nr:calnexin [Echinococcus multilocularis]